MTSISVTAILLNGFRRYNSSMGARLRLMQISCSVTDQLGGPSRVVKESHIELKKYFENDLIIFGQAKDYTDSIVCPSIFNNRYGIPKRIIGNAIEAKLKKSDVVLIHGFYTFVTLYALAKGSRDTKFFLMPHGSLEEYQWKNNMFLKYFFRKIFLILVRNRNFAFVVASESEKLSICKQIPGLELAVIGLGVNYTGTPRVRRDKPTPLKLVSVSRIAQKKRIDICIEALRLLRDKGISAELHIAGEGDEEILESLRELVSSFELEKYVYFYGHLNRNELLNLMPEMHIFLLPSENENFAIAVAEAICDGLPTIVSTNVAMHTFVQAHETGVVISDLNADELKNAILEVSTNLENYSLNARNSGYLLSWKEVIKGWEQVLCK